MALRREQIVQTAEKYAARGKIEPAIKAYRQLLAENPNDINVLNRVGDLYAGIHRIDEAVSIFKQIAEQYKAEKSFVKAIAIYKKINRLDPMQIDAHENLAELYHQKGLINEARTQYQILADYHLKHENATPAITIYQKMAELEPDNPSHNIRLAELYHQQRLTQKALREYRLIAELMLRHGRAQDAVRVYERAFDLDDNNLAFVGEAARTLRAAGHDELSVRFLEWAAERSPRVREVLLRFTRDEPGSAPPSREASLSGQVPPLAAAPVAALVAEAPPPPTSQTTQRVADANSATKPPRLVQSHHQTALQNAPEGEGRSSRDYASEFENLSFLRRKANKSSAGPVSPSTTKVTIEEPEKAQTNRRAADDGGGIFICYRRSDSIDVAGRVYDRLVAHYTQGRVFKDVDSIPFGVDFRKHLEDAVAQASIFVVVIGRSWLREKGAAGEQFGNLLSNARDFVRIEVELALRLNLPIIPLLVGGAKMPSETDLPESLADLAYRNGMELRPDPNFHKDMNRLIAGMDSLLSTMTPLEK